MSAQCPLPAVPQPQRPDWQRFGPVTQGSRKIRPDGWYGIVPGLEGRLLIVGWGADAFAWIDVRPEREATARPVTLFDLDDGGDAP